MARESRTLQLAFGVLGVGKNVVSDYVSQYRDLVVLGFPKDSGRFIAFYSNLAETAISRESRFEQSRATEVSSLTD